MRLVRVKFGRMSFTLTIVSPLISLSCIHGPHPAFSLLRGSAATVTAKSTSTLENTQSIRWSEIQIGKPVSEARREALDKASITLPSRQRTTNVTEIGNAALGFDRHSVDSILTESRKTTSNLTATAAATRKKSKTGSNARQRLVSPSSALESFSAGLTSLPMYNDLEVSPYSFDPASVQGVEEEKEAKRIQEEHYGRTGLVGPSDREIEETLSHAVAEVRKGFDLSKMVHPPSNPYETRSARQLREERFDKALEMDERGYVDFSRNNLVWPESPGSR